MPDRLRKRPPCQAHDRYRERRGRGSGFFVPHVENGQMKAPIRSMSDRIACSSLMARLRLDPEPPEGLADQWSPSRSTTLDEIAPVGRSWSQHGGRPEMTILRSALIGHDSIVSSRQDSVDTLQQKRFAEDHGLAQRACDHRDEAAVRRTRG